MILETKLLTIDVNDVNKSERLAGNGHTVRMIAKREISK